MAGEGEKTEKATSKKREDERKKGNVFQSKDIITVATITISFYVLNAWGSYIYKFSSEILIKYISLMENTVEVTDSMVTMILSDFALTVFKCTAVLMFAVLLVSIVATGAQTKFLISRENIKFKFSKLNPLKGLKKMVSMSALVNIVKDLVKICILAYVIYGVFTDIVTNIPNLMFVDILGSVKFMVDTIMSLVNSIIIAFTAISVLDFFYQWWEYEKNIKMSKHEVKEEYKQMEGDPALKGKIKEKQRQMAQMRMMEQVPDADVIIRNPTHYAIAIKYDVEKNAAPVVLAKGQDQIALKIIDIALENKIYIIENRPLARALYEKSEIDMEIPLEYYEPIAEILAWVYRLKEKGN